VVRQRRLAGNPAGAIGSWLPQPAGGRHRRPRPRDAQTGPAACRAPGVDGRLELRPGGRAHPDDWAGPQGSQAIPLPHALALRAQREQVLAAPSLRRGPSPDPEAGQGAAGPSGTLPRQDPRDHRTAPRGPRGSAGNEEYGRHHGSYGLTTLRARHVRIEGARLRFDFRARAASATRSTSRAPAWPGSCGAVGTSLATSCYRTWTRRAPARRSAPRTSTPLSTR